MARKLPCAGDVRRLVALTQQGLWAKDGNNFVYIERVKGDEELVASAFMPLTRIVVCNPSAAATAKFDPEHKVWRLSQVDESGFDQSETDHRFADGERHRKPTSRQTNWAWWRWTRMHSLSAVCTTCEVSEVERSGCRTLSAQHVEQNLPAAIRGGDDADGAVVHLLAHCVAYRARAWSLVLASGFVFYVLTRFGPLTLVYGIPPIIGALLLQAPAFS